MVRPQYRIAKKEAAIEEEACQQVLLHLGIFNVKLKKTTEVGWPDRQFILPDGKSLFIEFKRPGKEPRESQKTIHKRLQYFGHAIETHTSVEGAVEAVRRALGSKVVHVEGSTVASGARRSRTVPRPRAAKD